MPIIIMVVIGGTEVKSKSWAIIIGRTVVIGVAWVSVSWGGCRWIGCRLIHIKIEALGNLVFRSKPSTSPKHTDLRILVGGNRQSSNNKIIGTEVVKGPIRVAVDLQAHRGRSHVVSIYFDVGTWWGSIDWDVISHSPVRAGFGARRQ